MKGRFFANQGSFSKQELEKIYSSKIAIIGCGGLGGHIMQELASFGVKNLTIVDNDIFTVSNLNRQLYCTEKTLGKSKVKVCKEAIKKISSKTKVTTYNNKFATKNAIEILQNNHIVIDGVDNTKTRFAIAKACSILKIPYISCSVAGFFGQITTIYPNDKTLEKLYNKKNAHGVEKITGNFSFPVATIGSIGVSQVIKTIINRGDILRHYVLIVDLLSNEFNKISLL